MARVILRLALEKLVPMGAVSIERQDPGLISVSFQGPGLWTIK